MANPPNSNDAYLAALDAGMNVRFAHDDALAFLGNTRTWFNGSDYVDSAVVAMQTWPGLPDVHALQSYRAEVDSQKPAQQKSAAGAYDCATDTCSNGKALPAWSKWGRKLNCLIGGTNAGLCDPTPEPGAVVRSDGTGDDSGLDTGSWTSWGSQLLGFNANDAIKRGAFVLFALVLIGIAVWALVGKDVERAAVAAA